MKKINSEEYKKIVCDLLKYVDDFCLENNIKYFVSYGTLLGAIRHKGFIPWDDDIDICMPYEDYERFLTLFPNNDKAYILSPKHQEFYYNNFSRVCDAHTILKLKGIPKIKKLGAFIDVFPLYNVPDDINERKKLFSDISRGIWLIKMSLPISYLLCDSSTARKIFRLEHLKSRIFLRYFKRTMNLKDEQNKILTRFQGADTHLVNVLFDEPSERDTLLKKDVEEITRMKFENIEVNVPQNYDVLLKGWYGEYLSLPEESERISHHHFIPYKK